MSTAVNSFIKRAAFAVSCSKHGFGCNTSLKLLRGQLYTAGDGQRNGGQIHTPLHTTHCSDSLSHNAHLLCCILQRAAAFMTSLCCYYSWSAMWQWFESHMQNHIEILASWTWLQVVVHVLYSMHLHTNNRWMLHATFPCAAWFRGQTRITTGLNSTHRC